MEISKVHAVFFSPTGNAKKVICTVADAVGTALGVPVAYVMIAVFLIDLSLRILGFVLGFVITPTGKNEEPVTGRPGPHLPPPKRDRLPPH